MMAHAQKPHFVFRLNGRVHLNLWGSQFSRLLAAEVCASALVMLDTTCSEVVGEYWLPTPFASFPFTSPSRASPCATRFQTSSTMHPQENSPLPTWIWACIKRKKQQTGTYNEVSIFLFVLLPWNLVLLRLTSHFTLT